MGAVLAGSGGRAGRVKLLLYPRELGQQFGAKHVVLDPSTADWLCAKFYFCRCGPCSLTGWEVQPPLDLCVVALPKGSFSSGASLG